MKRVAIPKHDLSRRDFVRSCVAGAAGAVASSSLLAGPFSSASPAVQAGAQFHNVPLNRGWLFGGKLATPALQPGFDDSAFQRVTIPHCVAKLSWQKWDPAEWQAVWIYRRHFSLPEALNGRRVFLHFDGVMVGAAPVVNGHALPKHLGGYLPFQHEITRLLRANGNVLAVALDSRWSNTPPEGSPRGTASVDYLEPGGIPRPVSLRVVPGIFISDVFAKPVKVLDPDRHLEVTCSIDAARLPPRPLRIEAVLTEGSRTIARASRSLRIEKTGETNTALTLSKLGNVKLWDVNSPHLYRVKVILSADGKPLHEYQIRIGFRDARFEVGGFFQLQKIGRAHV